MWLIVFPLIWYILSLLITHLLYLLFAVYFDWMRDVAWIVIGSQWTCGRSVLPQWLQNQGKGSGYRQILITVGPKPCKCCEFLSQIRSKLQFLIFISHFTVAWDEAVNFNKIIWSDTEVTHVVCSIYYYRKENQRCRWVWKSEFTLYLA